MALRVTFCLVYDKQTDSYLSQGFSTEQTPGPSADIEQLVKATSTLHSKIWRKLDAATQEIREAGFSWSVKSSRPGEYAGA